MSRFQTEQVVHEDKQTFVNSIDFFNLESNMQKWSLNIVQVQKVYLN